jgi:GH15 family glucan-1,4-alpha-glucosidase
VRARKQFYWPDTNVLVTRLVTDSGAAELTDFMSVGVPPGELGRRWLLRRAHVVRGKVTLNVECRPAFDYAREGSVVSVNGSAAAFRSGALHLVLHATVPLQASEGAATARMTLDEEESAWFILRLEGDDVSPAPQGSVEECERILKGTIDYWHRWLSQCSYTGRWRESVYRSALALKLLTHEETGALIAAPTTSLPECLGGERNWDYRYTWIRDAAFTLYGLIRIGFTTEAARFMQWIEERCHEESWEGSFHVMYGLDGRAELPEIALDHLEGYKGSRPVRIGNAAHRQFQLDVYGELIDAVYLYNKYGAPISYDLWTHLRRMLDWVTKNWELEDEGVREVRGPRQHFVYSKLMCWVALDRGLRLADKRSFPADREAWLRTRDRIYESIMKQGWNEAVGAFVQAYGSEALDAANLIMPLVFFVAPNDPRMVRTLEAILRPLRLGGLVANGLVYRYDPERTDDGLPGREGTFNMCSFWLVEALARAGREDPARLSQARLLFENMLGHANHLGLFSEQTGPHGEALGNFPQAFTHLSLISAAFNLNRTLSGA